MIHFIYKVFHNVSLYIIENFLTGTKDKVFYFCDINILQNTMQSQLRSVGNVIMPSTGRSIYLGRVAPTIKIVHVHS